MKKKENKKGIEKFKQYQFIESTFVKNLIASMKDGFSILDSKGVHIDVNKALCQMTGFKQEELIGVGPPHPYWPEEEYENIQKAFKKTLKGEFEDFELTFKRKNGERFAVIVSPSWIKGKKGNVISYYATVKNITERKKAEQELKESELRLKKLFDFSPVGIVVATIDGKVEYVNNVTCNMFGYKKEEAIRMMTKEFFADPKERDKSIEIIKKYGQRLNYIFHYKKKDGKTGFAVANSKLIDLGKGLRLVVKLNDITKQKKLEKDKKILSEKIAKLIKKIPLTQNEKLVFYGLVKYPLLNDQQLSSKLNIKRSTITAIKNKLLRQGFYSTYVIPNFELIGCELMCIINGEIPLEDTKKRKKNDIIKLTSYPEVVFDINTGKDFLSIIVSKNFVETKRIIDYVSSLYEGFNIEMPNIIYFPFAMSRIINLFDYSNLLKSLFNNLKIKDDIITPIKSVKRGLTNNEKIILYALTKYPDLTDSEITSKTKISRPTISLIKKNLLKENFLKIINIPDAKKLNCELLAYLNIVIDSKKIDNQKPPPLPEQLIFMINSERESSAILIFEDYTTHKITYDKSINFLKKEQIMIGEPIRHLFPIQQIKSKKTDFAPLVKKIFELKVDF